MADTLALKKAPGRTTSAPSRVRLPLTEPALMRGLLLGVALTFLALFLVLPLIVVFAEAFSQGARVYFAALTEPEALAAIRLTVLTAAICVPRSPANLRA